MSRIDKTTFDQLVRLIETQMRGDIGARQQHIQVTFIETQDNLPRINYEGASMTVAERIVFALIEYGNRALWRLLKLRLYDLVGFEQKSQIDTWEVLLNTDAVTLHGDIPKPETPTPNIHVGRDVSAGIANIGGNLTVEGDVTVVTVNQGKKERVCPTAPNPPTYFTGRVAELQTLRNRLLGQELVAITAVQSMGGMGKTTLAQALCHLPDNPFKAVLWAEITQNPLARSHLEAWGRYAKPDFTSPADTPLEHIADYVRAQLTDLLTEECGYPVLIVFDDVWENGFETMRLLQRAAPQDAHILLTTRHDNVVREFQAKSIQLHELNNSEARAMLEKLRDNPHLTNADLDRTVQLIQGHPLALELAAASLNGAENKADISDILADYATGIREGITFDAMDIGADRPRSLNVVFGRSYNTLSADNQRYFRALGILAQDSTWSPNIAAALWDVADEREVRTIHKHLRTTALIHQDTELTETSDSTWYGQHPLLRSFALAFLKQHNEKDTTFRRYAEHITKVVYFFREKDDKPEEWGSLDPYLLHIHHVGDELVKWYAVNNEAWVELAFEFACNTDKYLLNRPEALFAEVAGERLPIRLNWLEMGLAASRQQRNRRYEGLFLGELGYIASFFGNNEASLKYRLQALDIWRELNNKREEAVTLSNIGGVYYGIGDIQQTVSYFQQALPIQQQVGDTADGAKTLNNIGIVYWSLGDNEQALSYFQQALPLSQQAGDKQQEAVTLNNIGMVYQSLGDNEQALSYCQQALPLSQQVGDKEQEAKTLNNMAGVYDDLGDKQQALTYYQQVIDIFQQLGAIAHEVVVRGNMAVLKSSSNVDEAIHELEQAIALLQSKNFPHSASGGTLEDYEAFLADLKRQRDGG
jgi:tetratricopeptide (TPR) repeat protein